MEEPAKANTWWNRNKDTVLCIGGIILVIAGGFLIIKSNKHSSIEKTDSDFFDVTFMPTEAADLNDVQRSEERIAIINGGKPFLVSGHVRNLDESRTASPGRRELARLRGIELKEHQTYVEEYKKNCA